MSNETKRDVFDDLLEKYQHHIITVLGDYGNKDKAVEVWSKRYEAALPDDLPVIPEAVSEWIKVCKKNNTALASALCMEMRPEAVRWWMEFKDGDLGGRFDYAGYPRKQELMASAWLLGVWRVEETGEIVKLEAEK